MSGTRILILITACFLIFQKAWASVDEPLPAFQNLFVSDYEERVFLSVMQQAEVDPLQLLLANAAEMDQKKEEQFRQELSSFVQNMKNKKKRISSDKFFLQKLFFKVHRKYLKEYKPFRSFYALLQGKSYNCLSGTALYALLLEELGYSYRIFETDYHIFLMVKTAEGEEILLESTDPMNGFLTGKEEINNRIEEIRQDVLGAELEEQQPYHDFKLEVFREIDLKGLAGLQYFNQAAHLFNNKHIIPAEVAIAKGKVLYQAERFDEFSKLIAEIK